MAKPIFILSLMLAAVLAPVGCVNRDAGKTVLRVATWDAGGDNDKYAQLVQQLYAQFEKENPGVEVRVENIPDQYVSKMILGFIAKSEPDVMRLDLASSAVFLNNGVLADMSPMIHADREFKTDDYFPVAMNAGRRGDAIYAIPQDFTPMVVYYNKRLFDKAGVPYPKPGWNFQDFLRTSQAVTTKDQYGFVFGNWMPAWIVWLWDNGGDVFSPDGKRAEGYLDSPQNVQTVTYLRDLIEKYKVAPTLSAKAAMGVDPFANGEAAMAVGGHWQMVGYANAPKGPDGKPKITWDDLGVVEWPHNTPQPHTIIYESGYGIGKDCKQKELAWKFIKFMTSHHAQAIYNSTGIAVDARKDVARERSTTRLEASFLPIIPSGRIPWGAQVEGYDFVEHAGESAMDSILQNGTPVDVALHRAAQQIDFEFSKQ